MQILVCAAVSLLPNAQSNSSYQMIIFRAKPSIPRTIKSVSIIVIYQPSNTSPPPRRTEQSQNLAAIFSSLPSIRLSWFQIQSLLTGRSTHAVRHESVFDRRRQSLKGLIDVDVRLGRALPERNTEFRRELLALFRADHFFVEHVALVSDQNLVDVHIGVLLNLSDPVADALEAASVRHVVYQENALGTAEIGGSDCLLLLIRNMSKRVRLNDIGASVKETIYLYIPELGRQQY